MKKFVVLALILAGVVLFQFASDFENAFSEPPPAVEEPLPEKAFVYVTGAVKNPGLYALETGKTAGEAVEAAGGMIAYADTGAVNLADRAEDGAHIHVPYDFQGIPENPAEAGKVSLNRADEKALTALPGIGPAMAANIIAYRQEHGSFGSIEELQKVKGIGPAKFAKLKDQVCL